MLEHTQQPGRKDHMAAASASFPPASTSLYELRSHPACGRGLFATTRIPPDTSLLSTSVLAAHVISREFKREVCAQCFHYAASRALPSKLPETGQAFCGPECLRIWTLDTGDTGLAAWKAVEEWVRGSSARKGKGKGDAPPVEGVTRPSAEEVQTAWDEAAITAAGIRKARDGSRQKVHRRAAASALSSRADADTLSLLLSGIFTASSRQGAAGWRAVLDLAADATPYASAVALERHVAAYLQLLCVLPVALLEHTTRETCVALVSRDSHNSFGIRSLDDAGSEMFGYGIWPEASYFNHSCLPNVDKKRVGKTWEFRTRHWIEAGDELCITYLGGDETELSVVDRRARTADVWGFKCGCVKCVAEEMEEGVREVLSS